MGIAKTGQHVMPDAENWMPAKYAKYRYGIGYLQVYVMPLPLREQKQQC